MISSGAVSGLQSAPVNDSPSASIRLVAIDLDGTLLNDARQVSEQTARALSCLPERDVKVVIASARPPRSVREIYRRLRLDTWQINYNGAMIWDEPAGRVVFHQPMPSEVVRRIVDTARSHCASVLVSCEILDKWYTDRVDENLVRRFATETAKLFAPDVIAPVDEFCTQPITKLLLLGEPATLAEVAEVVLRKHGQGISLIHSEPQLLQIMDSRAGKAPALRLVAEHYGVAMEQVMAIGDAVNDIEMLRASGVAVAMDNADPRVKEAARWVAPSNNDHGVHAALRRFGLCD